MQKRGRPRYLGLVLLLLFAAIMGGPIVSAENPSSTHYQISESEFGAGSTAQTCSTNYCSSTSVGSMAGGTSSSANGSATFGPVTPNEPLLEMIVENGTSSLGVLNAETTATTTMIVKIRTYLSSGYMLQIVGNPPKYGNHTLPALSSQTASTPGVEQFGINAVANTTPSVGANPVQVPDAQTSFGMVNDHYDNANQFMYSSGDVVAHSSSASGQTDYTISMILNISNSTPAGSYKGDFAAVVIPVF